MTRKCAVVKFPGAASPSPGYALRWLYRSHASVEFPQKVLKIEHVIRSQTYANTAMTTEIIKHLVNRELDRKTNDVPTSAAIKGFFEALSADTKATAALEKIVRDLAEKGADRNASIEILDGWCREHSESSGFTNVDGEYVYSVLRSRLPGYEIGAKPIEARQGRRGGFRLKGDDQASVQQETVSAISKEETISDAKSDEIKQEGKLESELYEPVKSWAVNNGYDKCVVVGNARSQGKWENPDLIEIVAEFNKFSGAARWYVTAFEVKPKVIPEAVWQAANYKTFAHEAYVVFGVSEKDILKDEKKEKVLQLAVGLGIGILCLDEEKKFKRIHFPTVGQPTQESVERALNNFSSGSSADNLTQSISEQLDDLKPKLKKQYSEHLLYEPSIRKVFPSP